MKHLWRTAGVFGLVGLLSGCNHFLENRIRVPAEWPRTAMGNCDPCDVDPPAPAPWLDQRKIALGGAYCRVNPNSSQADSGAVPAWSPNSDLWELDFSGMNREVPTSVNSNATTRRVARSTPATTRTPDRPAPTRVASSDQPASTVVPGSYRPRHETQSTTKIERGTVTRSAVLPYPTPTRETRTANLPESPEASAPAVPPPVSIPEPPATQPAPPSSNTPTIRPAVAPTRISISAPPVQQLDTTSSDESSSSSIDPHTGLVQNVSYETPVVVRPVVASEPRQTSSESTSRRERSSIDSTPSLPATSTPRATIVPVQVEAASATSQSDDSPLLTLESLEQMALDSHPALAEARAQVEVARGLRQQASLGPNPLVGFSGQQLFSGGEAEQVGALVEKKFVRGDKIALRTTVADREVAQAEQRMMRTTLSVSGNVRRAFVAAVIGQRRLDLADRLESIADDNERLTKVLVESQEASQVELVRARIQTRGIAAQREGLQRRWEAALSSLEAAVSVPLTSGSDLPRLQDNLPSGTLPAPSDDLASRLAGHPDLLEAELRIEQARWKIARESAEQVPDIDVQMVMQYDEALDSPNGILQMTGPLMIRDRNQGNIRAARAELLEAQRALERRRFELEQAFAIRIGEYEQARALVESYAAEDGVLTLSRRATDLLREGVKAGEQDLLALFLAEQERNRAELEYLDVLQTALDAQADLDTLLTSNNR